MRFLSRGSIPDRHPFLSPFRMQTTPGQGNHALSSHFRWCHPTRGLARGHWGTCTLAWSGWPRRECRSLDSYLHSRDASQTARGAPFKWVSTWHQQERGIAARGHKVPHIWNLHWNGENKAIADPGNAETLAACVLCGQPACGLADILCGSLGPTLPCLHSQGCAKYN